MRRLRFASDARFWLPVGLVLLAWLGSVGLQDGRLVELTERERTAYGERPTWQARFDALSAVCGVGLLSYDLREDYTPAGRWCLLALGWAGAVLYLAAMRQAVGRLWPTDGRRLPRMRGILLGYGVVTVVGVGGGLAALAVAGDPTPGGTVAWYALNAAGGVGLPATAVTAEVAVAVAVVSLVVALGWVVWLAAWRVMPGRRLAAAIATYLVFLSTLAAIVACGETARAPVPGRGAGAVEGEAARELWWASVWQVAAAAGGGVELQPIAEEGFSETSRLALAIVVLVGGLGGTVTGGIKWLVVIALIWPAASAGRGGEGAGRRFAIRVSLSVITLWLVTTFGLLLIEHQVAPAYQRPPTAGAALLEAASAVGGAGLTSGVFESITGPNLSSGMRQTVDQYQYGMYWLMLAMFFGRVVPLWMLTGRDRGADHSPVP